MLPEAFKYNSTISYAVSAYTYSNDERNKLKQMILNPTIHISDTNSFSTKFINITDKYTLPGVSSDTIVSSWSTNPMKFWQNQLNFAI